jgi:hypothetical protein
MKQALGLAKTKLALGVVMAAAMVSVAGAQSAVHGRNWKPLPPTAHVVVTVLKGFNGKPLPNAAVVFHAVRDGKNDGNLEVKTNPEGKAIIDVIEVGSHVTVQVIASGFATSATEMDVDGPDKELEVKLIRPREQISKYTDNDGKDSGLQPGVQEPPHPVKPTAPLTTDPTAPTAVPAPAAPAATPSPAPQGSAQQPSAPQ